MPAREMVGEYDRTMLDPLMTLYYGYSDFHNFGYWTPDTRTQSEASENLVERLLSFIPQKTGRILDVACGLGASTRHLLNYYKPEDIIATNISEVQLERGRKNAPGVEFRFMDAARLDFPDASFDNIICVEAAFHFDTREAFLREALRVLKPGGRLVHSDILMDHLPPASAKRLQMPAANYLEDPAALKAQLEAVGFHNVSVEDSTEKSWRSFVRGLQNFRRTLRSWPGADPVAQRSRAAALRYAIFNDVFFDRYIRYYVLASSQKP